MNSHIQNLKPISKPATVNTGSWAAEITKLEDWFNAQNLPTQPFKVNRHTTVKNAQKFLTNVFTVLRAHDGQVGYKNYLDQIKELKQYIINN